LNNAIWLFGALPKWFFPCILSPFSAGLLTAIPAGGVICLGIGSIVGVVKRQWRLLIFLLPTALSQIYVAVAGWFRGKPKGGASLLVFLVLQLVFIVYLVYRSKGARPAAIALALFCIAYALFAAFIAGMAFANDGP
jgi:hypothetical protein